MANLRSFTTYIAIIPHHLGRLRVYRLRPQNGEGRHLPASLPSCWENNEIFFPHHLFSLRKK